MLGHPWENSPIAVAPRYPASFDRDGHDGGQRIAPPARAAEIGHTMKTLPQASQSMSGPRSWVAFASPLWGIVEAAKLLARVAGQRVDQNLLRSAVGDPEACGQSRGCGPAPASSPPGTAPVNRLRSTNVSAGPGGRAVRGSRPRAGEGSAPAPAKPPRRTGQDEEPRVVGNQVKAAKLLLRQPPDPAVTGLELERASVPAHERDPQLAEHCDVAHARPTKPRKGR